MSKCRYQIRRSNYPMTVPVEDTCRNCKIVPEFRYLFELIDTKQQNNVLVSFGSQSPIAPEPMRNTQGRLNSAYHLNEMLFGS